MFVVAEVEETVELDARFGGIVDVVSEDSGVEEEWVEGF